MIAECTPFISPMGPTIGSEYDYPTSGIYTNEQYIDENTNIINIMLVGKNFYNGLQPQICFRLLHDHGKLYYLGLGDYYTDYTISGETDYSTLKKFLELEYMKLVHNSIQDDVSMNTYKEKRIELNNVINFLNKYDNTHT